MSQVITQTVAVTQADVLFVAQEMTEDLRRLHGAYPELIGLDKVLDLGRSISVFLINDAVARIGFSIACGAVVHHELRFRVQHGEPVLRSATNHPSLEARAVPVGSRLVSWVSWSQRMLTLSPGEQVKIVEAAEWAAPGTSSLRLEYGDGEWESAGRYRSGLLDVSAQEFVL